MKQVAMVAVFLALVFSCREGVESQASSGGAVSYKITHDCFKELRLGDMQGSQAINVTLGYGACGTDGVNTFRNLYMVKTTNTVQAALIAGTIPSQSADFKVVLQGLDVGITDATHSFIKIGAVDRAQAGALVKLLDSYHVDFAVPTASGNKGIYHYSAEARRFFDKESDVQIWITRAG